LLAGAASAAASWQRWINPFLDAGREMNVPARLAAGERLYRDVVYHYGPAGPWLEAAALALFGRRFAVLEVLGLLAAGVLFASLWRLTARAGSRLAACVATTWAAALCVGAPNGGSFLFPYSFDALFALAGAWLCLALAAQAPSRSRDAFASFGLAVALASKPEIGAAAAAVLLLGGLRAEDRGPSLRRSAGIAAAGTGAALALWTIALAGVAAADVFPEGPFALFAPPAAWRSVYRVIAGFDDPAASLASAATALFLAGLVLSAAWAFAAATRRRPSAGLAVWALLTAAAAGFFLSSGAGIEDRLPPLLAPMPVVAALATLALLRSPLDPAGRARFLLFGFSAACASRVLLGLAYGARTTPYSILALPGLAACAAVLVLDRLPRRLGAPGNFRRLVAVVFLALAVVAVARWRRLLPPEAAVAVHTKAGSLGLPADRARVAQEVLAYLAAHADAEDTLSGIPEAGFFNFVTGLRNPLRQEQILPGHLDAEREARVAERIARAGPRYFLLVNQAAPAFGPSVPGRDYAAEIWKAVEARYRLAATFGDPGSDAPAGDPRFFIRIYERRPAQTALDRFPTGNSTLVPIAFDLRYR
jgi:hypothetical protein